VEEKEAVLVNVLLLQSEETKLNPNNMLWWCHFKGKFTNAVPALLSLSKSTITWFGTSSGSTDEVQKNYF